MFFFSVGIKYVLNIRPYMYRSSYRGPFLNQIYLCAEAE